MTSRSGGRLHREKNPAAPSPVDLELDMAREDSAPARARATVKKLSAALDRDVLADATLLISELVSNAVKYGKGRIRLRVRARGSRHVLVEVLDEGRGFARPPDASEAATNRAASASRSSTDLRRAGVSTTRRRASGS